MGKFDSISEDKYNIISNNDVVYFSVNLYIIFIYLTEKLGYAHVMNLATMSVNELREGILKVGKNRDNPYKEAAKYRSQLIKDQPVGPREMATWSVEHIARHGGQHFKSSTR